MADRLHIFERDRLSVKLAARPTMSDAAVRLAMTMAGRADADGRVRVSQSTLAADLGWSIGKTKRTMRALQTAGVAVYEFRSTHRQQDSIIALLVPWEGTDG